MQGCWRRCWCRWPAGRGRKPLTCAAWAQRVVRLWCWAGRSNGAGWRGGTAAGRSARSALARSVGLDGGGGPDAGMGGDLRRLLAALVWPQHRRACRCLPPDHSVAFFSFQVLTGCAVGVVGSVQGQGSVRGAGGAEGGGGGRLSGWQAAAAAGDGRQPARGRRSAAWPAAAAGGRLLGSRRSGWLVAG